MKTKDNLLTIMGWLFIIMGISLMFLGIIQTYNYKPITKKVNCYDKYGSKILNQTCEKTYNPPEDFNGYFLISSFAFVGSMISFSLRSWAI